MKKKIFVDKFATLNFARKTITQKIYRDEFSYTRIQRTLHLIIFNNFLSFGPRIQILEKFQVIFLHF